MSTEHPTDPNATAVVLHFGIVPLPPMGCAAVAGHTDPAEARTVATWGRLAANVAGTWAEWGEDDDAEYADESLHVSVDVSADAASGGMLEELADLIREWIAALLPESARLMDYAIATDAVWSEGARVVTFSSSGPNVWQRARQDDDSHTVWCDGDCARTLAGERGCRAFDATH